MYFKAPHPYGGMRTYKFKKINGSNPEKEIKKILIHILVIYLVYLLYYSLILTSPVMAGEGHEYLGMTGSF